MLSVSDVTVKIVAHHVGARGFGVSLNVPDLFRDEVIHVLYEADQDCVARMLAEEKSSPHARLLAERHVLPFCLGRKRQKATLHVTANSYASSILAPNPAFFRNYCEISIDSAIYDVTYGDMLEVVREVEVEVQSIDQLFAEGKIPVQSLPDFLSIDTQGYELEILEGARDTVANGVLGVVCEVEMQPMYRDQPLLGDILGHLGRSGFIFAGFTAFYEVSPYRAPIGLRGKAFPGFGDALFLRDLDGLSEAEFGPDRLYVMLIKLAFIAVIFGYTEYALRALEVSKEVRTRVDARLLESIAAQKYSKFLAEFQTVAAKQEALFPPVHAVPDDSRIHGDGRTSFYDKHHVAALRRYQKVAESAAGATPSAPPAQSSISGAAPVASPSTFAPQPLRLALGRLARRYLPPALVGVLRRAASPSTGPVPISPTPSVAPMPTAIPTSAAPHPWSAIRDYTDFEKLLENWGFAGPAYFVRQRRLAAERYVRSLDSKMTDEGARAHLARD